MPPRASQSISITTEIIELYEKVPGKGGMAKLSPTEEMMRVKEDEVTYW